jgi:hypothetical protein
MRFTFVILLFCCLGADAQMIIKAHPNYRPYAVGITPPLDIYTGAAAAYSIRKLRTAYTGNCIRVRRSNDNTEQDIGFTSSGGLDTASMKTFVGTNSGFVTTWYDQSGNARNITQTTAANQPRIINAGIIERQNNNVVISFDGSNDRLTRATGYTINQPVTYFSVLRATTGIFFQIRVSQIQSALQFGVGGLFSGSNVTFSMNTTNLNLFTSLFNTTNSQFFQNTISLATGNVGTRNGGGETVMGAGGDGFGGYTLFSDVKFSEHIVYASNQSSNRTGIETNINSYYGIY